MIGGELELLMISYVVILANGAELRELDCVCLNLPLFCEAEALHFVTILGCCAQYSKHQQTARNPIISSSEL